MKAPKDVWTFLVLLLPVKCGVMKKQEAKTTREI